MTWVLLVILAVVVIWRAYEHHRTKQLTDAADRLGFQFQKKASVDPNLRGFGFNLFSLGYDPTGWGAIGFSPYPPRYINNVIRGTHLGASMKVFGYSYRTGTGRHSAIVRQTVCLFESDQLQLPPFDLCPENVLHKIVSVFGSQDIDFPESPNFSGLYLLRSEDEWAVRALFAQEVLRYFERHPDLYVEARSRGLIVYRSGKRVRPLELPRFLAQAREVYELFASGHTKQPNAADVSLTPDIEEHFEGIMRSGIDSGTATPTVASPNEAIMTGSSVGVGIHHLYANRHSYDGASTKGTRVFDCLLLKGRTSRGKWWLWWLAVLSACYGPGIIVSFLYYNTVVERAADQTNPFLDFSGFPSFLIGVMVVVVGWVFVGAWLLLAASVRRLHDMNRAGSWLLIILLPYLGLIILLICLGFFPPRPESGPNRYG